MKRPANDSSRSRIQSISGNDIDTKNDFVYETNPASSGAHAAPYRDGSEASPSEARSQKKTLSKRTKRIIKLDIILAIILIIALAFVYLFGGLTRVKLSDEECGADSANSIQTDYDITNVVFLGIDRQENRSDTIMVLSVNKTTNTLKVISLLRDSKVPIEGCRHQTKLGFAYKWGGAALALKTINQNFHTDYNQYVAMNFENVADIVDMLGGVDIYLSAAEAYEVNFLGDDVGYFEDDAVEGWNHLNGQQAVSYSRIREIDGEYERANRQQVVMEAMFAQLKNTSKLKYPIIISKVLRSLETTLSFGDMLGFASMDLNNLTIERYTIPDADYDEGLWGGWETVEGWDPEQDSMIDETQWVWIYDIEAAAERLMWIIYG